MDRDKRYWNVPVATMQSFEFGSELGYRPTCPKCDIPMMTVCVEPLGDGIRRTFECPQCDRFKIRKVKAQ